MKFDFTDPILLICGGVILMCLAFLPWAVAQYRRIGKKPATPPLPFGRDTIGNLDLPVAESVVDNPFEPAARKPAPAVASAPAPASVSAGVPAATKEVADRLESMNQRLSEMQAVLSKHSAATPAAAGGLGQGFSPETVDKLLKIIGNVITQVDVLGRSLGGSKSPSGPAAISAPPAVKPAAAPAPVNKPLTPPAGQKAG